MPNQESMKLFPTYLGPASDTRLDLGATNFRWNNLYVRTLGSFPTVSSSSTNATVLTAVSGHIAGFASTGITVTSGAFIASVVSSLVLSNSAKAYVNVRMLTHNAAGILSGDVYFFASSNRVYLAINSRSATYFVAMDT